MDLLDVHPIQSVVKVDDTVSGVGEALEAGCWGVGIAKYSNYMDIDSMEQYENMSDEEHEYRLNHSRDILLRSGAHYVIDELPELLDVVKDINERMSRGDKPT